MQNSTLSIDVHTHILPENIPNFKEKLNLDVDIIQLEHHKKGCARMVSTNGQFFRDIEENCWNPQTRILESDNSSVNVQVLSTVPVLFSYNTKPEHGLEISQFLNDHIHESVQADPKRFIGLGTIPMQDTDLAIEELERCVKKLKMPGIEIGTNVNQKNLDEQEFLPIFKRAEELDAAIFVHPWNMAGKECMERYWMPWLVGMPAETSRAICSLLMGGVIEKVPALRFAFAHGGGSFPGTIGRIEHGFNVRPDLCQKKSQTSPRDLAKNLYYDSLVHDKNALKTLYSLVGGDKIMLGSDYPFPLGEMTVTGEYNAGNLITESDLPKDIKEKIMGENALKWLNLPKSQFL